MIKLPVFQTVDRILSQMQTSWSAILNPFIINPVLNGSLISVTIASGTNVINHLLGRVQQGWIIVDTTTAITLYRSAAFNNLTLTLTSSGAGEVSLYVF